MEVIRAGAFLISVLYEDNHLLVVEKPANLPSQADSSGDPDLLSILKDYIGKKYNKPGAVYLGLVHRLDRPVGGAMVFARTSKAAARLSEAFRVHAQDRRYLAVTEGAFDAPLELTDHLLKDARTGMVRAVNAGTPGAKEARLTSRPLAARDAGVPDVPAGGAHVILSYLRRAGHVGHRGDEAVSDGGRGAGRAASDPAPAVAADHQIGRAHV